MGHFKYISKDILNIVSLRVWKSYLMNLNNEFKKVYYISTDILNSIYSDHPRHSNGVSIQWYSNMKIWYFNGLIHRNENQGPAVITSDYKLWYEHGLRHRVNGPAHIMMNGDKNWYLNGMRHRPEREGPAIELADGSKFWFLYDERHRIDGPAMEFLDGTKYWYLNDVFLTEDEFNKKKKNGSF